jgi:Bacterial aa3 type cytochrome c oxidase subunit IV
MSEVNGKFLQSKQDTFDGFMKITLRSIIGAAATLAFMAIFLT